MNQYEQEEQQPLSISSSSSSAAPEPRRSTVREATLNYSKGLIGAGLLTIPYFGARIGYGYSAILIAVCCYASTQAVLMLVTIADDMNHHHALYGHIIKRIFGHHTSIVIDVYSFIAVICQAITCIWFFQVLFDRSFSDLTVHLPSIDIYIVSLVVTVPLALITNIHDMNFMSWTGVGFCIATLIYVLIYEAVETIEYEHKEPQWDHYLESGAEFYFTGQVLFVLQNVFLALPIRRQMKEPKVAILLINAKKFQAVTKYSYAIVGGMLLVFVSGTVLLLGTDTEELAVYNIENPTLQAIAAFFFAVSILIAYSISIYPAFQLADIYIHRIEYHDDHKHQIEEKDLTWHSAVIRLGLTLSIYGCAIFLPRFSAFLHLQGLIIGIVLQFLFPPILFLMWFESKMNVNDLMHVLVILLFALIAIVVGVLDTIEMIKNR